MSRVYELAFWAVVLIISGWGLLREAAKRRAAKERAMRLHPSSPHMRAAFYDIVDKEYPDRKRSVR